MTAPGSRLTAPGLCDSCRWARELSNRRGSVFVFCRRSDTDERYPKYPTLPVLTCPGYDRKTEGDPV